MKFKRILIAIGIVLVGIVSGGIFSLNNQPAYLIDFVDRTCIEPHHKYHYLTCKEMSVKVNNDLITIPSGFDSDLASIPRWLWSILSPQYSAFVMPAILHDYLYSCPGHTERKTIDDIFYSALVYEGVTKFTAFEMWLAVRLFGLSHFNKNFSCSGDDLYESEFNFSNEMHEL